MAPRSPLRAYEKAQREQLAFAERAHRRQMLGNVATSFFQSLAANRPLQVATAVGITNLTRAATLAATKKSGFADALTAAGGLATDLGFAAYLANGDGGIQVQYDIPDVQSPGGEALFSGGRDPFLVGSADSRPS